jgi:hypothetical protein
LLTLRVALVFMLVLVLLLATVTLGVMGLGLASAATVLALLDRTTLGVDVMQLAVCDTAVSYCSSGGPSDESVKHTGVCAATHAVALDARVARPLLSIDDRHPGRSRPKAVVAPGEAKEERDEQERQVKMDGGVAECYSRRTNRKNRIYKKTYQRRGYLCQR